MSLTFVLSVGGFLGFAIMMLTELENQMNAVERVQEYTNRTPQVRSALLLNASTLLRAGG